ncbi:MAG TPA: RNA-binding protein [Syntrophothermus lipocalidus]|uniref:RNA-binding protein n=1 Tax=Syntrophothermus lipocalidus (strain DSM 12680 / TGB-C1) TaxID=643648 RepID=D7CJK0_SYNLT|nr:KOW domain-containing RNA-binding protein [Syntrophothermus lipocalidus]ADI02955.1 conserved hypothetical protein [Syntrophothermus lipocalidus DSM 12680]HHV77848.1 RNA-binding protein [Syntrophothermus lipocalidus]HOV42474.1 KOW domain-containing RNA-binding protein [Syntrophothermus lipocalidus]
MSEENLVGRLVYSKAGRDQGRPLLVIRVIDNRLVLVVDGDLRTVEKPKIKNLRHLQTTNRVASAIVEKMARGDPLSNSEVRKAIEDLLYRDSGGGGLEDG